LKGGHYQDQKELINGKHLVPISLLTVLKK
jgi:hypothetical protein